MKSIYLLDTCIASEPTRIGPCRAVLERLDQRAGTCAVPAVVWHELRYGTERLPDGKRKDRLRGYLQDVVAPFLSIVPYDGHAAHIHADLRADAEAAGRVLSFADGQIAATALANNLILVTRNVADFRGIRHLMVENWFEA